VRLYVEHGVNVHAGVKTSCAPFTVHAPATAGSIVGAGEPGATGPDNVTVRGLVPSRSDVDGSPVMRVAGIGAVAGVPGPGAEEGTAGAPLGAGEVEPAEAPCAAVAIVPTAALTASPATSTRYATCTCIAR
jgi:hypothetical protein